MTPTPDTWSWITDSLSVIGAWLMNRNPRWGWIYGLPLEVVWATEGWETGRSGDVIMAAIFFLFNANSLRRWRHTVLRPAQEPTESPNGSQNAPRIAEDCSTNTPSTSKLSIVHRNSSGFERTSPGSAKIDQ